MLDEDKLNEMRELDKLWASFQEYRTTPETQDIAGEVKWYRKHSEVVGAIMEVLREALSMGISSFVWNYSSLVNI